MPPPLTSAGAGTDEDEIRVKALMQRWFNYVCSNEVLMHDDEMVLFVESDFGYSPMMKKKQPATGVRRKLLKQFAPPPDDTPELAEARPIVKLFYLGSMDAGHKVDKLVKSRRGRPLCPGYTGSDQFADKEQAWVFRYLILASDLAVCMSRNPTKDLPMPTASLERSYRLLAIPSKHRLPLKPSPWETLSSTIPTMLSSSRKP